MRTNYWLVEATWLGGNEHTDRFISEGVWVNIRSDKFLEINKINEDDLIAVKASTTKKIDDSKFISVLQIKAIGFVTKNLRDGRHLEVNWEKQNPPIEIENMIKTDSICKLETIEEIKKVFGENIVFEEEIYEAKESIIETEIIEEPKKTNKELEVSLPITKSDVTNKKYPLNQIFFGPSGSGKTYTAMCNALEIIDGFYPNEPLEAKKRFNYYRELGQISFITFHESYRYEEFVEGLKIFLSEEFRGVTEYKVTNGIFKEIVNLAKADLVASEINEPYDFEKNKPRFFKITIGKISKERDNSTLNYCFDNGFIALDMLGGIDYSILENTDDWEKARDEIEKAYLFEEQSEDEKKKGIQAIYYFKNYLKPNDIVFLSNDYKEIIGICVVQGRYEFRDLPGIRYTHFRKVKWFFKNCSIPVEKLYKRKFSEQPIYELARNSVITDNLAKLIGHEADRKKNHVLIIDEINKGNVYKIFGELITLLDEQKRIGEPEELKLKLPYSNEDFGVPKNLYILATMNSSEKTDIFDTTLRRRFDFVEQTINYEILNFKIDGIKIDRLLETINRRIELILGKEFKIGHSYFLELKNEPSFENLRLVFKNKIIPLLDYYFQQDFEKIILVLGDNNKKNNKDRFVHIEKFNTSKLFSKNMKSLKTKNFYSFSIPEEPSAYIKVYS